MRPFAPLFVIAAALLCPTATEAMSPAPAEPTDDAWIEPAVREALDWEVMPGTSGDEPEADRADALRNFFRSQPRYRDPKQRALLAAEACGIGGTEAAHAWLAHRPARTQVVVEVPKADWKLVVIHREHHCTSDDWSWYGNELSEAAEARGLTVAFTGPDDDAVIVRRNGRELARLRPTGTGYLIARAGGTPTELGYEPTPGLLPALDEYFGGTSLEAAAADVAPHAPDWALTEESVFSPTARAGGVDRLLALLALPADARGAPLTEAELRALVRRTAPAETYRAELLKEATPPPAKAPASAPPGKPDALTDIFLRAENLEAARRFLALHATDLRLAQQRHGTAPEDLVAVLLWQSKLGQVTGKYRLFPRFLSELLHARAAYGAALTQGALDPGGAHLAKLEKRVDRATTQLAAHLRFCKANGLDPLAVEGVWGGGVGLAQLSPDAFHWLEDGDGDGRVRLDSEADQLLGLARCLESNGYRADRQRGLLGYNPGKSWVTGVMRVADALKAPPPGGR